MRAKKITRDLLNSKMNNDPSVTNNVHHVYSFLMAKKMIVSIVSDQFKIRKIIICNFWIIYRVVLIYTFSYILYRLKHFISPATKYFTSFFLINTKKDPLT